MKLIIPSVFAIDERTVRKNPIQRLAERSRRIDGNLATFTRDRLKGFLFHPSDGTGTILIVPPKSKNLPETHAVILGAEINARNEEVDVSNGIWLRNPLAQVQAVENPYEREIQNVLDSWEGAFSYMLEDPAKRIEGLRGPQIGALHAIHAHWAVSDSTATIVMPTGTGKTETMLSILVTARCRRLLVVVPSDALRNQIGDKFVTLGLLKKPGIRLLAPSAQYPFVCKLEHIPQNVAELDALVQRSQVIVTTSAIVGQCSEEIQDRFAHHCPYLFIDEAHHAEAPTWSAFKARFTRSRVVQFTATPFREDGRPLDGTMVFKYPLKKAQEDGYFKPIDFERVTAFDLKQADRKIAETAIRRLRAELDKGHILMARVENVKRAEQVFELYKSETDLKPVQLHTGITSARARDLARRQLISKESRIVVCVDMLGEGFDLPELKIAAFHDIRKSLAVTLQLAGRFTRARNDLGNATFIANVADVNVREELRKLYTRDPDWNVLLPALSERMIGEQSSLQDFIRDFAEFPTEIPLKTVKPATSAVVYATQCEDWQPERFRDGIPAPDSCARIHHSINPHQRTLVVVTARRVGTLWTDAESLFDWEWELYVAYWSAEKNLLFINSSSNKGEFGTLAQALTGSRATLISGPRVFRTFSGINRLRLQNVGLTEQIGRNVRYTGRMGSDVESRLTQAQLGNAQKSVLAGVGFENGSLASIGASRKGRIWSQRREHLDKFVAWCEAIGSKLLDNSIDPDNVLQGTLVPTIIVQRAAKMPLSIDWPESVYTENESNWFVTLGKTEYSISELSINLVNPTLAGPLRFEIAAEDARLEFELELFGEEGHEDFRFVPRGETQSHVKHGRGAQSRSLASFFYEDPPVIWFADGSALEGNQYIVLRSPQPLFNAARAVVWDWTGVDITSESQGEQKQQNTIQARVIRELMQSEEYNVIFDDDGAGELADVVTVRVVGGLEAPTRIEIGLYHCKYSKEAIPGHRVLDLYEVCGQAQKSIWWAASPLKKSDLLTHLMRRESLRVDKARPTRFGRGSIDTLQTIREIAHVVPVSLTVAIVQPGVSKSRLSNDQLQLLGVTENYLGEMYQLGFRVIVSA
jgi:superfamily II DNA or RNA helicase